MIFLVLTVVAISSILFSKHIFQKWFNHVALYTVIWYVMLYLYELKLMSYIELSSLTWFSIVGAFISFCVGSFIVPISRRIFIAEVPLNREPAPEINLFADNGKVVKFSILILSILGLIAAFYVWKVLIDKYGSIPGVFLNALTIYRTRVSEGGVEGVVPYIGFIPYVGVFLSGLYVAYKKKIGIIPILPFLAIIISQIAVFGRAGILFSFFLFIITFFLFRNFVSKVSLDDKKRSKFGLIISLIIVLAIVISAAGLIRSTRHTIETFSASSRNLEKLRGGFFITPSLYLYSSSHVGVFNAYLQNDYGEDKLFGETTFQPFYNFVSKFEWVEHPRFYEKGYFIPMWTNTGTYLRDLFGDFGVSGVMLVPFFLGLFASLYWFKFYEQGKLWQLVILTFLYVIIMFSFLLMYTRFANFLFSLVFLLLLLPLLEKLAVRHSNSNRQ